MKRGIWGLWALCAVALLLFPGRAPAATHTAPEVFTGMDWRDFGGSAFQNGDTLQLPDNGSGVITIPKEITSLTLDGPGAKLTDTCVTTENPHPGVTLTIQDLDIIAPGDETSYPGPGIDFRYTTGPNTLLLSGDNTVFAGGGADAGVYVPKGISLIIDNIPGANGSLKTQGNTKLNYGGAGIGGAAALEWGGNGACGTVIINGGTVEATGGYFGAAGIGGGSGRDRDGGDGGTVTITGGIVVAISATGSQDIGRGGRADAEPVKGTTTITGGSVQAGSDKVDNPQNANGTSLVRKEYTGGTAGATISFGVDDTPPYVYTFTMPSGSAWLWLPSAAETPDADAGITLTAGATPGYGGVTLTATPGPIICTWQRSVSEAAFEHLADTTSDPYLDATAQGGTTYRYRVAPIVVGKTVSFSEPVTVTMPSPSIKGLTADPVSLASSGGNSTITITGTDLLDGITVTAFDNANPTVPVAGGATQGNADDQETTLTFPANGSTTTEKVYTIKISLDGGTNYLDLPSGTVTVAAAPGPAQSLATLLSGLNAALAPHAVVPLLNIPGTVGAPIIKAIPSNVTFAKKDAPSAVFPGHIALTPSFSASVTLNADTTGSVLALKVTVDVSGLSGFENWGSLTNDQRVALLDGLKVIFAYEYADGTWKTLVGAGGVLSWPDALKAGIVAFSATGIGLNCAVTDAAGDPTASGGVLVIPDGAKDNKIVDPVWLLKGVVVPTALTLTPSPLTLEVGESADVKVAYTPAGATERNIFWTVGDSTVVSVTKASAADTWTVKGLSEGITSLIATASTDSRVKSPSLTVTVLPVESDLIESLTVSPPPPYHSGEEVEVLAKLKRAASSVTATVKRPDGRTDTPTVEVDGTSAWLTYTFPEPGAYTVTVKATDAATGAVWPKTTTLTVTEGGVKGDSGGGGCNAGFGLMALVLGAVLLKRR